MKRILSALTVVAILSGASAFKSVNFGTGKIYCFPSTFTVDANKSCAAQGGTRVDFKVQSGGTANPCQANQTPYDGSILNACTNENGQPFVSVPL